MPSRRPNAAFLKKEPTATHEALAEWITKTTGHTVTAGDVALIQRLYPEYLKSPAVQKAKEAEARARQEAAAAKQKEKEDRLKARLAEAEERAAAIRRQLGIDTDDETGPDALSEGTATVEPEAEPEDDEPAVLVLGTDEPEDEFVETTPDDESDEDEDDDDDDWGDDDDDEEDF